MTFSILNRISNNNNNNNKRAHGVGDQLSVGVLNFGQELRKLEQMIRIGEIDCSYEWH